MSKVTGTASDSAELLVDYPEGYGSHSFKLRGSLPYSESLRKMISSAQNSIRIAVPFVDDYGLEFLMECYEANPKRPLFELVVRSLPKNGFDRLRHSGVQLYIMNEDEHRWGFHAKYMIFDDNSVIIGSENLTERNIKRSLEIGVLIEGKAATQLLRVHKNLLAISAPT